MNTFSERSTKSEDAVLSLTHESFAWVPTILCLAANHPGYTMHLGGNLMWHESDNVA